MFGSFSEYFVVCCMMIGCCGCVVCLEVWYYIEVVELYVWCGVWREYIGSVRLVRNVVGLVVVVDC